MLSDKTVDSFFVESYKNGDYKKDYTKFYSQISEISKKLDMEEIPALFHPAFINSSVLSELSEQSKTMRKILLKATELYRKEEDVQKFFDFQYPLNEWLKIDPGYKEYIPISRFDGFWDGKLYRFCEYNTDGTSGMDEIDTVNEVFLNTEIGKITYDKFNLSCFDLRQKTLETILAAYSSFPNNRENPNIAIIDFLDLATMPEFIALKEFFIKSGYPCEICDIREVEFKNSELFFKDFRIDLVYRRAVTDDMYNMYTLKNQRFDDFIEAYRNQAVCVVGPLCSHIAHSKLILRFLTSEVSDKYFTEQENEFIKNHIPLTTILNNDPQLINKLLSDKDSYFLKPHDSNSGKGVCAGDEYSDEEWKKLIDEQVNSERHNYLVQEKIPIPTDNYISDIDGNLNEYKVNLSSYVFNSEVVGFFTRVSKGSVINTDRGAFIVPVFIK